MVTPYYILVSLGFGYFSLYPGKRSEKHDQSFVKHAVSSPAHSAERHYCDVR